LKSVLAACSTQFAPLLRAMLDELSDGALLLFAATRWDQHNARSRRRGLWGRSELQWLTAGAPRSNGVELTREGESRFVGIVELEVASLCDAAEFVRTHTSSFLFIAERVDLSDDRVRAIFAAAFSTRTAGVDWGSVVGLIGTHAAGSIRVSGNFDDPEAAIDVFLPAELFAKLGERASLPSVPALEASALDWLSRWCADRRSGGRPVSITIDTLDNPGWSLKVELNSDEFADVPQTTSASTSNPDDWTTLRLERGRFEGFGGPHSLGNLLAGLGRFTSAAEVGPPGPQLSWLTRWYAAQCDGDWEHDSGVRIATLDAGGWELQADSSANAQFQFSGPASTRTMRASETDWMVIDVQRDKFRARGGESNLAAMIRAFASVVAEQRA
jgi:hypothetical protein